MIFRGITEEMLKNALLKPDKVGMGYHGRSLVFKKFNRGVVKVVFIRKRSSVVIISVIWELIKNI